jgi:HEXXH motif-containing protein
VTVDYHKLPLADFDELAHGGGSVVVVRRLRASQLSKRLLALLAVRDAALRNEPEAAALSGVAGSFDVLARAHDRARHEVSDLLLLPGAGLWAMNCLRRIAGTVESPVPLEDDLAWLGSLALAGALRAGMSAEVTVKIEDGHLAVPGHGLVRVRPHADLLLAHTDGTLLTFASPQGPADQDWAVLTAGRSGWRRMPALTSAVGGERIALLFDDMDPARKVVDLPMAENGESEPAYVWQELLDEAWGIISRWNLRTAEAIAAGLTTVYPLRPTRGAVELSASSAEAFGALALTQPRDGLSFAAALVHEFQHTKLSALLDLVPLFEPADGRLFYAPWRTDPRPLPGLVQGAYAYLGLTEFWDVQRNSDAPGRSAAVNAHFEFALWREEVWRVITTLRTSGAMTPLGMRFLDGMRATARRHRESALPDLPARLARRACADTRTSWRLRNIEPAESQVSRLAREWLAGRPQPSAGRITQRTVSGPPGLVGNGRLALTHLRLAEPKLFEAARQGVPDVLDSSVSAADRAYGFEMYDEAAVLYRQEITRQPGSVDAWAGLTLSVSAVVGPGDRLLVARPELVRAVYLAAAGQDDGRREIEPLALVRWLARGVNEEG